MIQGTVSTCAFLTFSVLLLLTTTSGAKRVNGEKDVAVDSGKPNSKVDKHDTQQFSEKDLFYQQSLTNPETKRKSDYDKFGDYDGMQVDQPLDNGDGSSESVSYMLKSTQDKTAVILKKLDPDHSLNRNNDSDGFLFAPQLDGDGHATSEVWKSVGRLGQLDKLASGKVECVPTSQGTLAQMLGAAFNSRYMSIGKPSLSDSHPLAAHQKMDGAKLQDEAERSKKSSPLSESFVVNELFTRILDDEPVYNNRRSKRNVKNHHHRKTSGRHQHHHQHTVRPSPLIPHTDKSSASDSLALDTWVDHLPPIYTGDLTVQRFLQYIRRSRSVSTGPPWHCQSRVQWVDLGRQYFPRYLRTTECTAEKCWFGHFRCQARAFTVKLLRRRKDSCEINSKRDAVDERIPPSMQEEWVFEERAVTFCCECTM